MTLKDALFEQMMVEMLTRVHQNDPARGDWCVVGVVLANCGAIVEDVC